MNDRQVLAAQVRPGITVQLVPDLRAARLDPSRRGRFLTGSGLDLLDAPCGLAPRALRDITVGQAAGCFTIPDAEAGLSAIAGALPGLLRQHQQHPDRREQGAVDQFAEAVLCVLGVPAAEAARLAALPLPPTSSW